MRKFLAVLLLLSLAACGGAGGEIEPINLDDDLLSPDGAVEWIAFPDRVAPSYSVEILDSEIEQAGDFAMAVWNDELGQIIFRHGDGARQIFVQLAIDDSEYLAHCPEDSNACADMAPQSDGSNDCIIVLRNLGGQYAIAHELGHCAGFGHSRDSSSVMRSGVNGDEEVYPIHGALFFQVLRMRI